jgi:hypothetical protein
LADRAKDPPIGRGEALDVIFEPIEEVVEEYVFISFLAGSRHA